MWMKIDGSNLSNSQSVKPNASVRPMASGSNLLLRSFIASLKVRVTSLPLLVPRAPNERRSTIPDSRDVRRN